MAILVEVSGNLLIDPDTVKAFGYRFGDILVERSVEGAEIDASPLQDGCAVIATEAGLHPVSSEDVLGYVYKGGESHGPFTTFTFGRDNLNVVKTEFTDRLRQAPKGTYLLFRSLDMISLVS